MSKLNNVAEKVSNAVEGVKARIGAPSGDSRIRIDGFTEEGENLSPPNSKPRWAPVPKARPAARCSMRTTTAA